MTSRDEKITDGMRIDRVEALPPEPTLPEIGIR
jgi:hypothetical protein